MALMCSFYLIVCLCLRIVDIDAGVSQMIGDKKGDAGASRMGSPAFAKEPVKLSVSPLLGGNARGGVI